MNKKEIRKEIIRRLGEQDSGERRAKSEAIKHRLFSSEAFNKANVVMFYVAKDEEVDTRHMIKDALGTGKTVAVPYSESETNQIIASVLKDPDEDLEIGPYGVFQPKKGSLRKISSDDIDLVIVPGVAFDGKKTRLGRGKGYYDRFLKKLLSRTTTIGICFDFQLLKDLPRNAHDFPVSEVITN